MKAEVLLDVQKVSFMTVAGPALLPGPRPAPPTQTRRTALATPNIRLLT